MSQAWSSLTPHCHRSPYILPELLHDQCATQVTLVNICLTWPTEGQRRERGEGKRKREKILVWFPKNTVDQSSTSLLVVPCNGTGCSSVVGYLLLHTSSGFGCPTASPQFPCFACFGWQQAPPYKWQPPLLDQVGWQRICLIHRSSTTASGSHCSFMLPAIPLSSKSSLTACPSGTC